MAIYKTKTFCRFARRENLRDASLTEAVKRAERGLVDADLGNGLIKQRVAKLGQGRRSGYRILIAFRSGDLAVFMFGFAKNERDNISAAELEVIRLIANQWLGDGSKVAMDVKAGILVEVRDDDSGQEAFSTHS